MAILLSPLLAGETLHSNFSRYAEEVGLTSLYRIYNAASGALRSRVNNLHRPCLNFERLAQETEMCWGKGAAEIILEHTVFQYDTLFLKDGERERRLQAAIVARNLRATQEKILTGLYDQPFMKYCDRCIEEAKRNGFPGYFRLMHQLPGVRICPIHETLLSVYQVDVRRLYNYEPLSFGKLKKMDVYTSTEKLSSSYLPAFLDVARRSQTALQGGGECMRRFPYSTLLEEGALKHKKGSLKVLQMKEAMFGYYGAEFCVSAGITNPEVWKDALGENWRTAPFRHILMQSFLAFRVSGAGEFSPQIVQASQTLQEVCCGGALHRDEDKWLQRRSTKKGDMWLLPCSCTRTLLVRYDGEGKVMQTRVWRYGKQYFDEFSRLVKGGSSTSAVARRLDLPRGTREFWKRKLLSPGQSQTAAHQKMVLSLRRAWSACVRRQPSVGRLTLAAKDSPTVYKKLCLYDSVWLKAFNCKHRGGGHGKRMSAKWLLNATLLKSARESLLALERPVQITWTRLVDVSGVGHPSGYRQNAELVALRKELSESFEEFRDRSFEIWLKRLANSRPRTLSQFQLATGLRRLTPDQRTRLSAWLQKSA